MRNLKLSAGSGIDSGADILILQRARGYKRYYFLGGKLHHTSLASLKLVDARPYDLYGFYDNGNYYSFETDKSINKEGWKMKLSQLRDGLEKDNMSFIYSNALKSVIFGESEEDYSEGLYEYLMRKFNLPLKKEWMTYVKNQLIRERFAFDDVEIRANNPDATCSFNGKKFKLDGRRGIRMDTSLTEDNLIEILKKGVR
jgi:hypothetical protein